MQLRGQVASTKERPNISATPEKTIGGASMAGLGGAGAGAAVSSALGLGTAGAAGASLIPALATPAAPLAAVGLGLGAALGGYFDA